MKRNILALAAVLVVAGIVVVGGVVTADPNIPENAAASLDGEGNDTAHYYPADRRTTTDTATEDVIAGLAGMLSGDISVVNGYRRQGLEMQRASVNLADRPAVDEATGFSVTMWINPDTSEAANVLYDNGGFVDGGVARADWNAVWLNEEFLSYQMGNFSVGDCHRFFAAKVPGGWNHLAFTVADGAVDFYVNGVNVHSTQCSDPGAFFTDASTFGIAEGFVTGDEVRYAGVMDEMTIHDYRLTPGEVNAVMEEAGDVSAFKTAQTRFGTLFINSPSREPAGDALHP